jgi:L-serine dehydratase
MADLTPKQMDRFASLVSGGVLTLGELAALGDEFAVSLSEMVVQEAMLREGKSREMILDEVFAAFEHNLEALAKGLADGSSFLLGTVAGDLAKGGESVLIDDSFLDKAQIYTLAAEVGNHEVGLRPCAGTGDSCPYTGIIRAMMESGYDDAQVRKTAALLLKVGGVFRAGKVTTGCNMEGYGAGAAATAAALCDLRGGTAGQAAKAMVLAISPTIAVPCTPRVITQGLCATHIAGAILIGNLSANLVLRTTLPVDIDIDVMIAMAARIHREAAPVITKINVKYLKPYFCTKPQVEAFVDDAIKERDQAMIAPIVSDAREEMRALMTPVGPLGNTLGDVVVGGSSIAVGSPTNMARIAHALIKGRITKVDIDLTHDLFERRAINVPGILMGAVFGAHTSDGEMYKSVMDRPEMADIEITVNETAEPEVQRIRIQTEDGEAWLDSRNRGGARVAIVDAGPSRQAALEAAHALGIQVVD